MSFQEKIKIEVKEKTAFRCCRCQSISVQVHHIIPQEFGGQDTIENAAPLCPTCHVQFGDNPKKRKEITQMRDWWYKKAKNMFSDNAISVEELAKINSKLEIITSIRDQIITLKNKSTETIQNSSNKEKYSSITDLISEVENKDESEVELDIFDLTEKIISYFNLVTTSVKSISNSLVDLTARMKIRTKELNKFNNIKDNRLRRSKMVSITNPFANELDEFNIRINNDLPILSENFIGVGETYPKLFLIASSYGSEINEKLRQPAIKFRDSAERATKSCADMLQTIIRWPTINPKFNKSKRETELTLKNLTKEMLEGLMLLNEAIKI